MPSRARGWFDGVGPVRKVALFLAAVMIMAGAGWFFSQRSTPASIQIQTVTLTDDNDIRSSVSTTGTLRPLIMVEIGSQLSGQIAEIYVDYSSPVEAGQVIALINPDSYRTRVREAEALVSVAEATIAVQKASVDRAVANLERARNDHARASTLAQKGTTSQAALDVALNALRTAEAELAMAKAQLLDAEAVLLQRQANLDNARIDLERTQIRSPIKGVVLERSVNVGQTVAASLSAPKLFTIAEDLKRMEIDGQVDEADIGQVKIGDPVRFTVDAYPGETFKGKVQQIRLSPTTLDNIVTYTVVISTSNEQERLLPGMTANIEIITGERLHVLAVPNQALRFEPQGPARRLVARDGGRPEDPRPRRRGEAGEAQVFVLEDDGHLSRREVKLGASDSRMTEVVGGNVKAGDRVATGIMAPRP
jgi:HlyD family secretion protein